MKYVDLAVKTNELEGIKAQAEKNAPILASKVEAVIASQKAKIMEKKADLIEKENAVEVARGVITTDVQEWLSGINTAKDRRDMAAEDLNVAEEYLEDLKEEAKLFA